MRKIPRISPLINCSVKRNINTGKFLREAGKVVAKSLLFSYLLIFTIPVLSSIKVTPQLSSVPESEENIDSSSKDTPFQPEKQYAQLTNGNAAGAIIDTGSNNIIDIDQIIKQNTLSIGNTTTDWGKGITTSPEELKFTPEIRTGKKDGDELLKHEDELPSDDIPEEPVLPEISESGNDGLPHGGGPGGGINPFGEDKNFLDDEYKHNYFVPSLYKYNNTRTPISPTEGKGGKGTKKPKPVIDDDDDDDDDISKLEPSFSKAGLMYGYIPSWQRVAPPPVFYNPIRKEDQLFEIWDVNPSSHSFKDYVENIGEINDALWKDISFDYSYDENSSPVLQNGYMYSNLLYVGNTGKGKFTQLDGEMEVTDITYLGFENASSGEYYFNGGKFGCGQLLVGVSGEGLFEQTGGSNFIGKGSYSMLYIGVESTGRGTYNLYDGSLGAVDSIVGYGGMGTFTQKGGTHTAMYLNVGYLKGSKGYYEMWDGNLSAYDINLGVNGGYGEFTQKGGNVVSSSWMSFGYTGGTGRYLMEKGNLTSNTFHLGINNGTGTFEQNGGVHKSTVVYLGYNGGNGNYSIYDGAKLYTRDINIGDLNGSGEFHHYGGTVGNINGAGEEIGFEWMSVGIAGGNGSYFLGGEEFQNSVAYLTDTSSDYVTSFFESMQNMTQNDLSFGMVDGYALYIGYNATGYFFQNGATVDINQYPYAGYGDYYLLSTTKVDIEEYLHVGYKGTGKYFMNGGILETSSTYVGDDSGADGLFVQSGGIHRIRTEYGEGILYIGNNGGYGKYVLGKTGLLDADYVNVGGYNSIGKFYQYDGIIRSRGLNVAEGFYSSGVFYLYGGTINTGEETIAARSGSSGMFDQYGGTNNALAILKLAEGTNAYAKYNLYGGILNAGQAGPDIYGRRGIELGTSGFAELIQYGGELDVTGDMKIAVNSGSTGAYKITGGIADINGNLTSGMGSSTLIYDGGSLNVAGDINVKEQYFGYDNSVSFIRDHGSNIADNFYLGYYSDATYELTGNSFLKTDYPGGDRDTHLIDFIKGMQYIGYEGNGNFIQSGNSSNTVFELTLGYLNGSTGTYTQKDNSTLNGVYEVIGRHGTGNFIQENGTNTTYRFYLGHESDGIGNYTLSGGTLTTTGELIGVYGTGNFLQTGGTNKTTALSIATNSGTSVGTYTLSGGTLDVISGQTTVGEYGTGSFVQNKINPSIDSILNTSTLVIGFNSGSKGSYDLQDGTLNATSMTIGKYSSSSGVFNQTGGTSTFTSDVTLAANSGSKGSFKISGGIANISGKLTSGSGLSTLIYDGGALNVAGDINVKEQYFGYDNTAVFSQDHGTNTAEKFYIGYNKEADGTYELKTNGILKTEYSGGNGDSSDLNFIKGIQHIGYNGTGTLNQTGGTNSVFCLFVGYNSGSTGRYNLQGNAVVNSTYEVIGRSGTGSFSQSGGTNTVHRLYLGYESGATGSYMLAGGNLNADMEYVGYNGNGSFTQTGGTNTTPALSIGTNSSGRGLYTLSGGTLNTNSGSTLVGENGTGQFIQNKIDPIVESIHNTADLSVGINSGAVGTYTLNNGSLSVNGNSTFGKNAGSMGTFNQNGGSFNCTGSVYAGSLTDSEGIYNINAGTLSAKDIYVGNSGKGIFNQTGGNTTVSDIYLGFNDIEGCSGKYNLSGGELNVTNLYVGKSGSGEFNQTGGTNNSDIINIGSAFNAYGEKISSTIFNHGSGEMVSYDGKVYFFGGYTWYSGGTYGSYTYSGRRINGADKLEVYDPSTGIFSELAEIPSLPSSGGYYQQDTSTRSHAGSFVLDGKLYFVGGQICQGNLTDSLLRYNPDNNTWSIMNNVPSRLISPKCAVVNDKAYIVYGSYSPSYLKYTYEYNPVNDSWALKTAMPLPVEWGTHQVYDGKIYVFGGGLVAASSTHLYRKEVQIYDPLTDTWSFGAPLPDEVYTSSSSSPSYQFGSAICQDKVYLFVSVFYGYPRNEYERGDYIYTYDLVNNTWDKMDISDYIPENDLFNYGMAFTQLGDDVYYLYDLIPGAAGDSVSQSGVYRVNLLDETSKGTYNLSGGTIIANKMTVGHSSTDGSLIQTGGDVSVNGDLILSEDSDSSGLYEISGGELSVGGNLTSGAGLSTLIYDGGALNVAGNINVNEQFYGFNKTAGFTQNHGTNTAKNFYLGYNKNITGTYTLENGSVSADKEYIGFAGGGIFNHKEGSNTATDIIIGCNPDSTGIYNIEKGNITASNIYIGKDGTGTLNITNSSASIVINQKIEFGIKSHFDAVQGSSIVLNNASFDIQSIDPQNLQGLNNLDVIINGNCSMEIAGADIGADPAGFELNFALDSLIIGAVDPASLILYDIVDNQSAFAGAEALYVNTLILGVNSTLNLNGKKIYYKNLTNDGTVNLEGGALVEVPDIAMETAMTMGNYSKKSYNVSAINPNAAVPEPSAVLLFIFGSFLIRFMFRRNKY